MLPLSPNKKKELIKAARIYTKEPISAYHQHLDDEAGKIALKDPSQDLVVMDNCWNGLELLFMKVDMPTKREISL